MCSKEEARHELHVLDWTIDVAHRLPTYDEVQAYVEQGTRLVVSDVDTTLTDGHKGSVCPDADEMVQGAYEAGMQVAIVSNDIDRRFVHGVAERLDVPLELTFYPQSMLDPKPSPVMIQRAITQAGVSGDEVLAVGDGITDVIAFFAAGVQHIRVVLARPEEVGGYPGRSQVRSITHGLGRAAMPLLSRQGVVKKLK